MTDNLYFDIAAQADRLADKIRSVLDAKGVPYLVPGVTNQIFPILPKSVLPALAEGFAFTNQQEVDKDHHVLDAKGVPYLVPGVTNQIFPILPKSVLPALAEGFAFTNQQEVDKDHQAIRLCTSWATCEDQVEALCRRLEELL